MKYLSICSGIEAATVAWHGFGWEPVAFSEIEPFPSAVLAHHYPNVPNLGDMTKFAEWPEEILAECDILVGGPPCQAFSVAGLRRSLDDDRGNITLAYVRLLDHIDAVRRKHGRPPAIAVYENVPGLLSTKDNAFGCLIGALAGCDEAPETETGKWPKAGYVCGEARRVGYRVLDAQYFGVAQRRRRIFLVAVPCEVVASLGERACPSEILSLSESLLGNPPTRGAAWEGVARAATACSASRSGGGEPFYLDRASFNQGENAQYEPQITNDGSGRDSQDTFVFTGDGVIADPIGASEARTYTHEGTTFRLHNCVGVCATGEKTHALTTRRACEKDGTGRGTPIVPAVSVRTANTGANGHGVAREVTHTIDQAQGQAIAFKPGQSEAAGGTFVTEEFRHAMQVRRLTPTECCRLQGFPDDHCDITFRKKPAADGPKYRALGNSMAVPCMWWIGSRIHKATHGDIQCH